MEEILKDKGTVYIIKNGKVITLEIAPEIPREDIEENKLDKVYFDEKELELVSKLINIPKEKLKRLSPEHLYACLADSGYTVIRKYAKTRISDNFLENYAIIANQISKQDIPIIKKLWRDIGGAHNIGYNNIYNRVSYSYGGGYESLKKVSLQDKTKNTEYILDVFLRDKIGELTLEEEEMLDIYRNFDLKKLLTTQESVRKYPINNDNSGIYLITPEEVIGVTIRNGLHQFQARDAFANLYFDEYAQYMDKPAISDECDIYNTIIVQISSTMGVPIIPWIPRKINSFQYNSLIEFCETLSKIKEETGLDFDEIVCKDPDGKHLYTDITGFREMIEAYKQRLVDDTIVAKKSPFPTRTDITTEQIVNILEGKVEDKEPFAKIYIIKDGKVVFKVKGEEYKGKEMGSFKSDIEIKLYQELTGRTEEDASRVMLENIYGDLVDNGYTIVRLSIEPPSSSLFIGSETSMQDIDTAFKICGTPVHIHNRVNDDEFEKHIGGEDARAKADFFVKEKMGQLTEEEIEMLNNFKRPILKQCIHGKGSEGLIKNYNRVLMLITEDDFITRPVGPDYHTVKALQILRKIYYEQYDNNFSLLYELQGQDIANTFSAILISQLENDFYVFIPEKINEYQYKKLENFAKAIKSVSIEDNTNGSVFYFIGQQLTEESEGCTYYNNYLENLRENKAIVVDNGIEFPRKSMPPKVRKINDNFLADIFGIELKNEVQAMEDTKSIGENQLAGEIQLSGEQNSVGEDFDER